MKAILVVSHGSKSSKTKEEVIHLIQEIQKKTEVPVVRFAFLELESPSIPEGIEQCVTDGAKEVFILLNFLNAGRHVDEDIPGIVQEMQEKLPDIVIKLSTPVGQHKDIPDLFCDLLCELSSDG